MNKKVKHIAFLVIPDVTLLDVTGPYEVFSQAIERLPANPILPPEKPGYMLHTLSTGRNRKVRSASGMVIQCENSIDSLDYEIDTLFIPGVPNSHQKDYRPGKKTLKWIHQQSLAVKRICSVCTGTFLLAEAGILNGKKATTHWELCEILANEYPDIEVDKNSIFVKDGNIYTSAGISSGMDLALSLVEEDFGKTFALEVAKQMVLYLKRPGSQSQYSQILTHQHTDHRPIQQTEEWILDHLDETITIENLAERASMSMRNFARVFIRETGITPAQYISKLRLETACRYLADTQLSLKEVAHRCGLGSIDNMRKVFLKHIQISPADYRKNFGTSTLKK